MSAKPTLVMASFVGFASFQYAICFRGSHPGLRVFANKCRMGSGTPSSITTRRDHSLAFGLLARGKITFLVPISFSACLSGLNSAAISFLRQDSQETPQGAVKIGWSRDEAPSEQKIVRFHRDTP